MTRAQRDLFDRLVERVLESLPGAVLDALEEMPLVVLDAPSPQMLADLEMAPEDIDELAGLHSGFANTETSLELSGELPSQIHLFRRAIIALAGGWPDDPADLPGFERALEREIRITILHEIGHQMGLTEEDLEDLGYD